MIPSLLACIIIMTGPVPAISPPPDYRVEVIGRVQATMDALVQEGRLEEAIALGRAFQDQVEPAADIAYSVGLAENRLGNGRAALRAYDRTIVLDSRHAGARYDRGELRLKKGDVLGAQEDFEVAAAEVPDHWVVHFRLAHVAARQRRGEDMKAHLLDALRHGFDFRTMIQDPEWRTWSRDPELGSIIGGLVLVYSDEALLEQMQQEVR